MQCPEATENSTRESGPGGSLPGRDTVLATVANARHDELSPRAASKQGLFDVESDSDRTLTPRIAA